jgi:hypothetical protein
VVAGAGGQYGTLVQPPKCAVFDIVQSSNISV